MKLPKLYFRLRDNGAQVFRVDTENARQRLDMIPIAHANTRNGEIRHTGGAMPTPEEEAAIRNWIADRQQKLAQRPLANVEALVEQMNATTHWLASQATVAEAESVSCDLLMSMHDLRSALIRARGGQPGDED